MPSNHLILCRPLLLLPSIFPGIRAFSNESALRIRWPKYWSFSFSINPSNKHPGLISFQMDWLDLPVVQGTLKSLLQHHSSKASILQHSAFFIVQPSHPYMTTEKSFDCLALTFVGKVVSLLLNMLSRLVITFLPRKEVRETSNLKLNFTPKVKMKVKSLSCVRLFATLWTVAYQASLSMGFSRQEYWIGLPFPSPGDLPDTGIKSESSTLQVDSLPSEP